MTESKNKAQNDALPQKKKWLGITLTTIISIAVTISVALYQIKRTENQRELAEAEKIKNVKSNLIAIVEDHVINTKPISISLLTRLTDLRRREEGLNENISILEIIKNAEYNIINTRYLEFQQKDKYKAIFDTLYSDLTRPEFQTFKNGPYVDILNELSKNIQEGNTNKSLELLTSVYESFNNDINKTTKGSNESEKFSSFLVKLKDSPSIFLVFILTYMLITIMMIMVRPSMRSTLIKMLTRSLLK